MNPEPALPAPTSTVQDIAYGRVPAGTQVTVYAAINNLRHEYTAQGNLWAVFDLRGLGRPVRARALPAAYANCRPLIDLGLFAPDDEMQIPLVAAIGQAVDEGGPVLFDVLDVTPLPRPEGFRYGDDTRPVLAGLLAPHHVRLRRAVVPDDTFGRLAEIHDEWRHEHCSPAEPCPGNTGRQSQGEVLNALHTIRELLEEEGRAEPGSDGEGALRWVRGALNTAPEVPSAVSGPEPWSVVPGAGFVTQEIVDKAVRVIAREGGATFVDIRRAAGVTRSQAWRLILVLRERRLAHPDVKMWRHVRWHPGTGA